MSAGKTSETLKTLRDASRGLIYTSESDAKIKAIAWTGEDVEEAKTPLDAVAKAAGVEPETVEVVSVETFFAPLTTSQTWWGDEEKEIAAQFGALVKALSTLPEAAAHRVGDGPDIDVYVVGRDPALPGGFAGVKTRVTET